MLVGSVPPLGSQVHSPGPAGDVLRRMMERPRVKTDVKRRASPVCSAKEQCHRSANVERCRTAGCERRPLRRRLPRISVRTQGIERRRYDAIRRRINCAGLTAFAGGMVRRGASDCTAASFSQLRLSVVQAKAIHLRRACKTAVLSSTFFESTKAHPAWQQRRYGEMRGY